MRSVALLTPTHRGDLERFDLLCESIDRFVHSYERHYVIVNDDDLHLFAKYASGRRIVEPSSKFLPRWLWSVPRRFTRNGRRIWLSLLSRPVHGWHVQQLLKIGGALAAAEDRICIVDSDNLFFRSFDVGLYAGGEKTPLYVDRAAIARDSPTHAPWACNARELLGLPAPIFPADDYVGNILAWDRTALKAMTEEIRLATGLDWRLALCRRRQFSEYLLYGNFVAHSPRFSAEHDIVEQSLAAAHWEEKQLDEAWVREMMANAEPQMVALCIQSFSGTNVPDIRSAMQGTNAA
jgi:hypothetical protein